MAYCEELRMERQCKATRKDGKPCRGYAVWGGVKCVFHGGQPEPGRLASTGDRIVTAGSAAKVAATVPTQAGGWPLVCVLAEVGETDLQIGSEPT